MCRPVQRQGSNWTGFPRQVCAAQISVTGMSQSNVSHLLFRQPFIYLFICLSIYQISNNCGKSFYFEILVRDSRWWVRLRWHNEAPTKEEERFGFRELGFSLVINKKKNGWALSDGFSWVPSVACSSPGTGHEQGHQGKSFCGLISCLVWL